MQFTDEALREFKSAIETEFGQTITLEQAREVAGRVMLFYEGLACWLARQEPATPPDGAQGRTDARAP